MGKVSAIVGRPSGWEPQRESDHFMLCPVCGELVDMRRLDQALAHWHDGPPGSRPAGGRSLE